MNDLASNVGPTPVAVLVRDLCDAAGGRDLATVIPPLCRAAGAIYAHFEQRPELPRKDRYALLLLWRSAEDAARMVLPAAYCDGRGGQGFAAAFGLLYGPGEGAITDNQLRTLTFMLREFVNDLDSMRALLAMAAIDPTAMPLSALFGVPYSSETEPGSAPWATVH